MFLRFSFGSRLCTCFAVIGLTIVGCTNIVSAASEDLLVQRLMQVAEYELGFVSQVCQLSNEQFRRLEPLVREQATELARRITAEPQANRGLAVNQGFRFQKGVAAVVHPLAQLQQLLYTLIHRTIPESQQSIYEQEYQSRETFWAETIAANLLVRLTDRLRLSTEQQVKLRPGLVEWSRNYVHLTNYVLSDQDMIPSLPDNFMFGHLDADQRGVWAGLSKIELGQVPCDVALNARFQ